MHHQGHETTEVGDDHFRSTGVKLWATVFGPPHTATTQRHHAPPPRTATMHRHHTAPPRCQQTRDIEFNGIRYQTTSLGDCRHEKKIREHWSFFIKLLSLVTAIFLFFISNQEQFYIY